MIYLIGIGFAIGIIISWIAIAVFQTNRYLKKNGVKMQLSVLTKKIVAVLFKQTILKSTIKQYFIYGIPFVLLTLFISSVFPLIYAFDIVLFLAIMYWFTMPKQLFILENNDYYFDNYSYDDMFDLLTNIEYSMVPGNIYNDDDE